MIYKTYRQLRTAIEEETGDIPNKMWGSVTSYSCMNFHPPFDEEDLKDWTFAIKKLMENMPQR